MWNENISNTVGVHIKTIRKIKQILRNSLGTINVFFFSRVWDKTWYCGINSARYSTNFKYLQSMNWMPDHTAKYFPTTQPGALLIHRRLPLAIPLYMRFLCRHDSVGTFARHHVFRRTLLPRIGETSRHRHVIHPQLLVRSPPSSSSRDSEAGCGNALRLARTAEAGMNAEAGLLGAVVRVGNYFIWIWIRIWPAKSVQQRIR